MSQDKHVLHLRSNQSNNYPTSDKTISGTPIMDYGEIAINYAADNEFISIKNSNNTLTLFRAWPYIEQVILDNELVTASALTTLKESCGFDRNGKYAPSTSSKYISEAITITDALDILDENLSQTYTKNEIDSKGYLTEVPEIYPTYDWIWEQNFARFDNIPTSTSDLINDSDFITTTSVNSLIETHDTEIKTLIEDNEKVVATAITKLNDACGFDGNIQYQPNQNANYVGDAKSLTEAVDILDSKLGTMSENSGALTYIPNIIQGEYYDTTNGEVKSTTDTYRYRTSKFSTLGKFVAKFRWNVTTSGTLTVHAWDTKGNYGGNVTTETVVGTEQEWTLIPSDGVAYYAFDFNTNDTDASTIYVDIIYTYAQQSEVDTLSVQVNTNTNNITSINNQVETLTTTVSNNEEVTAAALTKLNESCGFNENKEFVPSTNATYISEATNVTEALNVLDEKLSSPESLIGLNYVKGGYADFIWDTTRFDNTNVNLTQIMYSVTGLKSGDEITVSFDYQISGVDFSSANASISVQSHTQWGYQTFNFTVNQNTSGHHSFTTHITTATTVIESTVMCPYIRLSLIGGDENSIIKISNFTIVKGNKEILNTISKSDRDYHNGFNKVNTLSNISSTKRSVLCSTNVDQSFYLDIYNDLMPNGEEMHILVQNTNTTNNITIAFSTASHYVLMSGSSLTIQPSSWGEINVLRLGHKYYVRSI